MDHVSLIECPRDAMQGWKSFIPTEAKTRYINSLLKVGFDTIDFGSFVSAKAIPQMADTAEVLKGLTMDGTSTRLLAIVANIRGANDAASWEQISFLGYPFSISETFQKRNTNSSIADSLKTVEQIQSICINSNKQLVIYISMGFGNPYGDPWSQEVVFHWVEKVSALGVKIISLADTVGLATPEQVFTITDHVVKNFSSIETGVHLHSSPHNWRPKIDAAVRAGCSRFDGALKGIGGCPMANDELVGNMNTEWMIPYFEEKNMLKGIDTDALNESLRIASEIFV